jgi:hypothetical protein
MAVMGYIDPEFKFQVNQVERILKKAGADSVTVWKHPPENSSGYVMAVHLQDNLYIASGESLALLTESMKNKIEELI